MATNTANEDGEGTTTVQVTYDVWAALDKRKERGQSFNDVITRLIDASAVPMGSIKEPEPEFEPEWDDPTPIDEDTDKGCAFYDVVSGESCSHDPEYRQRYRMPGEDEWSSVAWCEEHAPF